MTKKFLRIDHDQYDAATTLGPSLGRSVAQQVNHWVRVGRELEASAGISQRAIAAVLETSIGYDELNSLEQAIVRATWAERSIAAREGADAADEFALTQWERDDQRLDAPAGAAGEVSTHDTMA